MKRDYDIRWYFIFSNIKIENESYTKTHSYEIILSVGLLKVIIHLGMKFKKDFLKEIVALKKVIVNIVIFIVKKS
jgi:hypothetical protein